MEGIRGWLRRWQERPLGLRLAAVGIALVFLVLEGRRVFHVGALEGERFICAKRDLETGTNLSFSDLTVSFIPKGEKPPQGGFTDQEVEALKGAEVVSPISKGEFVVGEKLKFHDLRRGISDSIPKGYRAYPLKPEGSVPLVPGDHVDVTLMSRHGAIAPTVILENNKVLAVREQEGGQEVMLAVLPEEISVLDQARNAGVLGVVVRSAGDSGPVGSKRAGWQPGAHRKPQVEVLEDGL